MAIILRTSWNLLSTYHWLLALLSGNLCLHHSPGPIASHWYKSALTGPRFRQTTPLAAPFSEGPSEPLSVLRYDVCSPQRPPSPHLRPRNTDPIIHLSADEAVGNTCLNTTQLQTATTNQSTKFSLPTIHHGHQRSRCSPCRLLCHPHRSCKRQGLGRHKSQAPESLGL